MNQTDVAGEAPAFTVLIPARLASTRLPNKPLADIAGIPMVVRVAQRARQSGATRCVVAADDDRIVQACEAHGIPTVLTRVDHSCGSDRLAEACDLLGLADDALVVNLQGDEPLIEPALVGAVAAELQARPDCVMSTAAHAIDAMADFLNPNVVKVVLDRRRHRALFQPSPDRLVARRHGRAFGAKHPALASTAAPHRPLRLPGRVFAAISHAGAFAAGAHRIAGATARVVARRAHCGAHQRPGARHWG